VPPDADAASVAEAIVGVVDTPFGKRPFRVHIDPTQDGAEVAFAVIDRPRDVTDLEVMLEVLRRCLHRFYRGQWPGIT